ncbi:MAG TPA: PaaI family thioesterase [Gammaproteobacteria bacterium]|jgi:uncharacterized protein (TIGR00369 family)|nr:PaaI family thioesterase [Gammaproteobacteria bacterium]
MTTSHDPTKDDFKAQGTGYLFDHLGMSFSFADSGEVTARLDLERHHFAWKGRIHAGTLFALADSCAGHGCIKSLPEGASGFATVEAKTNFVATVDSGAVRAVARPLHLGKKTQLWDVEVTSEENQQILAYFRCTQMIIWPR